MPTPYETHIEAGEHEKPEAGTIFILGGLGTGQVLNTDNTPHVTGPDGEIGVTIGDIFKYSNGQLAADTVVWTMGHRAVEAPRDSGVSYAGGRLELDQDAQIWAKDGQPIPLVKKEYSLLTYFGTHPYKILSRQRIYSDVWGYDYGSDRTVIEHVRRVRDKLGDLHYLIETWRSLGWAFGDPERRLKEIGSPTTATKTKKSR